MKIFRAIVGRGPVPRHAAVSRNLARDRPSRYGIGKVLGPSDAREGQALALREKTVCVTVGRGPVPRHAAVYRNLAGDGPPRYGIGKVLGPSDDREGQALALR